MRALLLLSMLLLNTASTFAAQPDHSTWLKKEARAKLRPGMSQEDVKKALGEAARMGFAKSPGGTTSELEYRSADRKDWINLFFVEGRFTHYSIARLGTGEDSSADKPWRSQAAWAKVEPGMSLHEVEKVLGKPTAMSYDGGTGQEILTGWLYDMSSEGSDPATGIVFIVNGEVLSIKSPLFSVN